MPSSTFRRNGVKCRISAATHFPISKIVIGGEGNDIIIASAAVETFAGGDGNDIFVFSSSASAGRGSGSRDRIIDFEVGDRIDSMTSAKNSKMHSMRLSPITDMSQVRHYRSAQAFSRPGQLRVKYDEAEDRTVLEGNIDRTPDTEFEIELSGNYSIGGFRTSIGAVSVAEDDRVGDEHMTRTMGKQPTSLSFPIRLHILAATASWRCWCLASAVGRGRRNSREPSLPRDVRGREER